MCDTFAAECPGVIALHQKNQGLAGARNTGIAAATGEWLLFLDSDDEWAPGMLQNLRAALEAHPGFDWYVARYLSLNEADGTLHEPTDVRFVPGDFESDDYAARVERLYDSAHWSVWKYCLKRQFLLDSGVEFWPSVVWAEDYPFDLLLLRRCRKLCFLDMVMTHYRENRAGSLMNSNLPKHFTGILAALRGFAQVFAEGQCLPPSAMKSCAAPPTLSGRKPVPPPAGTRRCAVPAPLSSTSAARCLTTATSAGGRADWVLFRLLLKVFGARFALWFCGHLKKG